MREHTEDGRVVIHVNADELYDPLSMGSLRQLNGDIFDYVEGNTAILAPLIPIRVVLHGVGEKDRQGVPELFRRHYKYRVQDQLWEKRANRLRMLYMTLIGVVFVAAYLLFAVRREDNVFLEILSVIGSFALCEAVGCFLIERISINRDMYKAAQYMTAEIVFRDGEEREASGV